MKKTIANMVVAFSLVLTLVLSAGVAIVNPETNANDGISICSDLPFDDYVEY